MHLQKKQNFMLSYVHEPPYLALKHFMIKQGQSSCTINTISLFVLAGGFIRQGQDILNFIHNKYINVLEVSLKKLAFQSSYFFKSWNRTCCAIDFSENSANSFLQHNRYCFYSLILCDLCKERLMFYIGIGLFFQFQVGRQMKTNQSDRIEHLDVRSTVTFLYELVFDTK